MTSVDRPAMSDDVVRQMEWQGRFLLSALWGGVATLAMSVLMLIGMSSGVAPMPEPVPIALVKSLFAGLAGPFLVTVAVVLHLGYGALWGGLAGVVSRPMTIAKGIGLGIFLWSVMQLAVLPVLGWGLFGLAVTPKIAIATLVLHLVYGVVFGWTLDRVPKE